MLHFYLHISHKNSLIGKCSVFRNIMYETELLFYINSEKIIRIYFILPNPFVIKDRFLFEHVLTMTLIILSKYRLISLKRCDSLKVNLDSDFSFGFVKNNYVKNNFLL